MDARKFLAIEESLMSRLRKSWAPVASALYNEVKALARAKDFNAARDLILASSLRGVAEQNREFIRYSLWAFAVFGASNASTRTPILASGKFDTTMNRVATSFIENVAGSATEQMQSAALKLLDASEAEYELTKKSDPRYLKEFVPFAAEGMQSMQLIASLHASRLSTWGFTAEADVLGLTEYQLSAVLDSRTSEFCRIIHGHTFRVADALDSINTILSVQNPDDVRTLQPWPRQDKESLARYAKLTAAELTSETLHIPPYHPGCRTLCIKVGKKPLLPIKELPKETDTDRATESSFKELGIPMTDKQVEYWNTHVGISPVSALSKLSGTAGLDLLKAKVAGRMIRIGTDGRISFKMPLAAKNVVADAAAMYDPFTGKLFANYLEMKAASPHLASMFMAQYNIQLMEAGKEMGASLVVVTGSGELGAYAYGSMGYVPSQTGWYSLKQAIQNDLMDGTEMGATVASALSKAELKVLEDVLSSPHVEAYSALSNLPFKVKGMPLGKFLLANRNVILETPVDSAKVLANWSNNL